MILLERYRLVSYKIRHTKVSVLEWFSSIPSVESIRQLIVIITKISLMR